MMLCSPSRQAPALLQAFEQIARLYDSQHIFRLSRGVQTPHSRAQRLSITRNLAAAQAKEAEAASSKKKSDIPIPMVSNVESYEREYLPTFQQQNTYIRGRGVLPALKIALAHWPSGAILKCRKLADVQVALGTETSLSWNMI